MRFSYFYSSIGNVNNKYTLYLVLCVRVLLLEAVVPLHVHELRLPPEELVLLVHQVEQLHYQVLGLEFSFMSCENAFFCYCAIFP